MHLAKELLATTQLTVGAVATRVGCDSEEALSHAFNAPTRCPPANGEPSTAAMAERFPPPIAGIGPS
jgi:transcriptional regulator GlxA family with amidase domain